MLEVDRKFRRRAFEDVQRKGECVIETETSTYILRPEAVEKLRKLARAIEAIDYTKIISGKEGKEREELEALLFEFIGSLKSGECARAMRISKEIKRKSGVSLDSIADLCHSLAVSDFTVKPRFEAVAKVYPEFFNVAESYSTELGEVRILEYEGVYFYDPVMETERISHKEKIVLLLLLEKISSGIEYSHDLIEKLCSSKGANPVKLAKIAELYFNGLGSLQYFIADKRLTDVFVTQRGEVSVEHYDYGFMKSTVRLSTRELHSIAQSLRMLSGLPFDESSPTLEFFWSAHNCRVSAAGSTSNYTGNPEYAIRIWPEKPWTLIDLMARKSISSRVAALLTLLINLGCGVIIAGDRGAGKSTFLQALLLSFPSFMRKVCLMTSRELHNFFYEKDFNISEFRVHTGDEVTTEGIPISKAVKQMLIHGESRVVVFNEVKFKEEAAPFFTATAAAGVSSILTTMHADDAESIVTRLMIDFELPLQALRNIDFIITLRSMRHRETMKRRALIYVTEILPFRKDPVAEERLENIVGFDPERWEWKISVDSSSFLKRSIKLRGLTLESFKAKLKELSAIYEELASKKAEIGEVVERLDRFFLSL